ncbi:MAG: tetratricopeptide repeat protein [Fermentimonas sp.]|jgi:tetratricopeptide (TPR) repeat protein
MKKYKFIYLLISIFLISNVVFAEVTEYSVSVAVSDESAIGAPVENEGPAIEAEQSYRNQNYKKSIDLLETAINDGLANNKASAELYYNLGNSYYRDGRLGKAILNYERALLLAPGDRDIRHNLKYANERNVDRIVPTGNVFIVNWFTGVRDLLSSRVWGIIGICFFLLLLVSMGMFLFVGKRWVKITAFYCSIVLLVLAILVNVLAFSQKRERERKDYGIIMTGAAEFRASPDLDSKVLFELHEGAKVRVRSVDGDWREVEIANGSVGWTNKDNLEII